jgi:hypothetical protein
LWDVVYVIDDNIYDADDDVDGFFFSFVLCICNYGQYVSANFDTSGKKI